MGLEYRPLMRVGLRMNVWQKLGYRGWKIINAAGNYVEGDLKEKLIDFYKA